MADTLSRPPWRRGRRAVPPLGKLPGEPLEREQHDPIVAPRRLAVTGRVVAPAGEKEIDVVESGAALHRFQRFQTVLDEPEPAGRRARRGQLRQDDGLGPVRFLAIDVRDAEVDAVPRQELPREATLLGRDDDDARRASSPPPEAFARARRETVLGGPDSSGRGDPYT